MATAVTALVAAGIWPYLAWSVEPLVTHGLLVDDAFFYSVIVKHILHQNLVSFDGLETTNGFQPLWMFLHTLQVKALPTAEPIGLLARLSGITYLGFAFAISFYAARRGNRVRTKVLAGAPIALLLLQPGFQRLVLTGLEVPLALLAVVLCMFSVERIQPGSERRASVSALLVSGACGAVAFLARTDLFWCVPLLCVAAWLQERGPLTPRARAALLVTLPSLLLVAPYLWWNYTNFDALIPISGRVKQYYLAADYPTIREYLSSTEWLGLFYAAACSMSLDRALGWNHATVAFGGLAVIAAVALTGVSYRRGHQTKSEVFLAMLVLLHVVYMHLVYRELRPYSGYYFAYVVVWMYLCFGRILASPPAHAWDRTLKGFLLSSLCLLFANAHRVDRRAPNDGWTSRLRFARAIERVTPPDETIAAYWPGTLAYFSGRRTISMDGIVGSENFFQNYLRTHREFEYMRLHGATRLALFLPSSLDALLAQSEAPSVRWSQYGTLRLWEERASVERTLAEEPVKPSGAWYLVSLDLRKLSSRPSVTSHR